MKPDLGPVRPVAVDLSTTRPVFDPAKSHQKIVLRGLKADINVGLHPWEMHRERPTRVVVDVELYSQCESLGDSMETIIDYDPIRALVTQEWPTRPHTPLLETWVEELVAFCFRVPEVDACRISIQKPHIFTEADGVGVEVYRLRPRTGG